MLIDYFYCSYCGHEASDIRVEYVCTNASGDVCICPNCGKKVLIKTEFNFFD